MSADSDAHAPTPQRRTFAIGWVGMDRRSLVEICW